MTLYYQQTSSDALPVNDISKHISSDGRWIPLKDPDEIREYAKQVYTELYEVYKERVKTKKQTKEAYLFSR